MNLENSKKKKKKSKQNCSICFVLSNELLFVAIGADGAQEYI